MPIVSGGGAAFNGGTITQPLAIVAGDPATPPLQVTIPSAGFPQASSLAVGTSGDTDIVDLYVDPTGAALTVATATQITTVGATGTGDDRDMLVGNTSGVHQAGVSGNGLLQTANQGGGAPADGEIAPGQVFLWFDKTNGVGATKLMVKGKSADGTVKTATIVLA